MEKKSLQSKLGQDPVQLRKDFDIIYNENIALRKNVELLQKRIGEQLQSDINNFKPSSSISFTNQQFLRLRIQNERLTQKIKALSNVRSFVSLQKGTSKATQQIINNQKKKSSDLLKVIQKQKQQISRLVEQNRALDQNVRQLRKAVQSKSHEIENKDHKNQTVSQSVFIRTDADQSKLKETLRQLEREKSRGKALQNKIRNLQFQNSSKRALQEDCTRLRKENRDLQLNYRKLTDNVLLNRAPAQGVDFREKAQKLQGEVKGLKVQLRNVKEGLMTFRTQAQHYQQKCLSLQSESKKYQDQVFQLKKKAKLHPVLNEIIVEGNLEKVLGFLAHQRLVTSLPLELEQMAAKSGYGQKSQINTLLRRIEQLTKEKAELAGELMRTNGMLQALKDSYQYKQKISDIQRKQATTRIKEVQRKNQQLSMLVGVRKAQKDRLFEAKGIRYCDDVSQFSNEATVKLAEGQNFFDFLIGDISLIERNVGEETKSKDVKNIILIATLDFYNFQTQHTKPGKGLTHNFMSEMSFRVKEDHFFIDFLDRDFVVIQIWTAESSNPIVVGQAKVPLKALVQKSRDGIAPVVNSQISLYAKGVKIIGTISYRMRMRLPIHGTVKRKQDQKPVSSNQQKLVINIVGGQGLSKSANSFAYFGLLGKDYYTASRSGPSPNWDYWTTVTVNLNDDFIRFLKSKPLSITVIDDNAPLHSEQLSDVIGVAQVSLTQLITNASLNFNGDIRLDGSKRGVISVRCFWQDKMGVDLQQVKSSQTAERWHETFKGKLIRVLKQQRATVVQSFKKLDKDENQLVQEQEMVQLVKQLKLGYNKDQTKMFYKRLPQPFDLKAFDQYFGSNIFEKYSIKQLNSLLQKNSKAIEKTKLKTVKLREFLFLVYQQKGSAMQMALQIDCSQDGLVSMQQLQSYLLQKGVGCGRREVQQLFGGRERIKISEMIEKIVEGKGKSIKVK